MRMYQRLLMALLTLSVVTIVSATAPISAGDYTVYFQSDRDGDAAIYRVEGDDAVAVTGPGCLHPSVTADGSMVLFTRLQETLWGTFWNVFILEGDNEYRLSTNEIYDEMEPVVSHDGSYAAFTTMRSGNLEIVTLPIYEDDLQYRITENEKPDELPALAAGGEWVYWTGRTGLYSYIFKAPGRGGEAVRITEDATAWEESPSISADGRFIAYTGVTRDEDSEDKDESDLMETEDDSDEGEEEDLTQDEGNYDIWVLDTVTGERTRLTINEAWDGNPCISGDGEKVVFASDRDGNREIYMINRDGTGLTRLSDNEAEDDYPTIT